jgi:transposase-like protein/IS1 family transposase
MQKLTHEPMDPLKQFCPNAACSARGKKGMGNIRIHDRQRQRYRCQACHKTFTQRTGTMFEGLRKPTELIVIVVGLLSYGCPLQAIVQVFGLDERTVASWRDRAGDQCQRVHQTLVEQEQLDLVHVQADEIRVKGCSMVPWMGLAMMVSTRLWLAGTVSLTRDHHLADQLMRQVRRCAQAMKALLVCTDGWSAYPRSIRKAFREKVKTTVGRGRASLLIWPQLHIATVIKRSEKRRVVEVIRKMTWGSQRQAQDLLARSAGGNVLNTAFIERLNGTMRERLASLTRKSRHAAHQVRALETGMYLVGTTYNFCWAHQELSKPSHQGLACSPAMAAGLTDHLWSLMEVFSYKVAPVPWVEPKRRRRPKNVAASPPPSAKRTRVQPLLRLRKGRLHASTV